jgi:hypothetical protein
MKKILLYILLSVVLISCGKNKEEVFDKCLKQANETYGENLKLKGDFVTACMIENNFKWDCFERSSEKGLLPICYEVRKNS